MGGGKFQVVGLGRMGHTAAGEKGPPQKGLFAVVFLHHRQIDVQGQRISGGKTEGLHNAPDFFLGSNPIGQLSLGSLLRKLVKAYPKGLAEQLGKQTAKILALGDDFNAPVLKTIAKQQNAKALRQGTVNALGNFPAYFRLCGGRKGLHGSPSFYFQIRISGSNVIPALVLTF